MPEYTWNSWFSFIIQQYLTLRKNIKHKSYKQQ